MLLLQDDRHSPDVEEECDDEDGKSKAETEGIRNLRIRMVVMILVSLLALSDYFLCLRE